MKKLKELFWKFYIKSVDEMKQLFSSTPEALENTLKIAESCDLNITLNEYHLPKVISR